MKEKEETKEKNTKEKNTKEEETKEKNTKEKETKEEEDTGDGREKGECYGRYFFLLFKYTHRFPHFLSIIILRNERRRIRT